MDRKLLATIRVYEYEQEIGSRSMMTGENEYEVELAPKRDAEHAIKAGAPEAAKNLLTLGETTFSHELGHVVALIMHDPTHSPIYHVLARMTGDARPLVPAEKKAWELAHIINPKLDTRVEVAAIHSTEQGGL